MIDHLNPQVVHYDSRNNRWEVRYSLTHPGSMLREVITWCWTTFGYPGTNPTTGVKSLWDYHAGYIYFYDEKYVTMYNLRWL